MTVPLPTPSNPKTDAAAVRKRRRRAPAGGAADDCFTCSKRGVKCDRRRPYCSQCLEIGNECSGYKTQLTWGVGVASRGKLRGLSLPIAKSPPVNPVKKASPRARANSSLSTGTHSHTTAARAGHWSEHGSLSPESVRSEIMDGPVDHHYANSMPPTPYHAYDFSRVSSHAEPTPPLPAIPSHWHNIPYPHNLAGDASRYPKLGPILIHEPLSASIDSLSDTDYMSPISTTFSRDDLPYVTSPPHMYAESYTSGHSPVPQSPVSSIMMDHGHGRAPTSCPSLVYAPSEPSSSLHSHLDGFEAHLNQRLMEYEPLGEIMFMPQYQYVY